jgi:hypothetical protein
MPAFLLIGIPIVVAVLLFAILSLPDDEPSEDLFGEKADSSKTTKASKSKKKK